MLIIALAFLQPTTSIEAAPTPVDISRVFERFCLRTGADRINFDAEIAKATNLKKISSPSLFSGVEMNRRWKSGAIELSFTDAPAPTPRSCGVTAKVRGGFDGQAISLEVAKASAIALHQSDGNRWMGMTSEGHKVLVNNRPNPNGYGDVEIVYLP